MSGGFFEVEMTDPRQAAQEQAEASFDDFIKYSKYGLYASIAFLLMVGACNFGVEDNSFPAYNGEQYAPTNLNNKG